MNNILELPQLTAEYSFPLPETQVLLVSGGNPPDTLWLRQVLHSDRILWCADHGVDVCNQVGCIPAYLVGDGDSASPQAWQWAERNHTVIRKVPCKKDVTDTQLALQSIKNQYNDNSFTIMTGAWGGRFDHAFSAIYSLQSLYSARQEAILGCIADQREALFFLSNEDNITLTLKKPPKAISLLPLSGESTGVSINGVYWPLDQVLLDNKLPYAVSNEMENAENTIWVSQKKGLLGIYLYWEEK